ncbi:MAG: HD domain-containing protein [Promethearchaeota archaeon]
MKNQNQIENFSQKLQSLENEYLSENEIKLIRWAENIATSIMEPDDVHGIGHVKRVVKNCYVIANKISKNVATIKSFLKKQSKYRYSTKIDYFILIFSAWLHDIGRFAEKFAQKFHSEIDKSLLNENHANISVKLLKIIIKQQNISINQSIHDKLQKIYDCINSHSFSANKPPNSLEAQILSDADKLDALGAIGIYRASCFQHDNKTNIKGLINHFYKKLLILNSQIYTNYAKKIAKKRISFMKKFLKNLSTEI